MPQGCSWSQALWRSLGDSLRLPILGLEQLITVNNELLDKCRDTPNPAMNTQLLHLVCPEVVLLEIPKG